MIKFLFRIQNPTKYKTFFTSDIDYCITKRLSKNKSFEFQFSNFKVNYLLSINIETTWNGQDHAGPRIEFEFMGLYMHLIIYDHRHWNYETNSWETYNETIE
jgi:hypothetical protein